MIKAKAFWLSLFTLVALTGCATLYQKEGVFTNGFSDYRKSEDLFVVTFRANEHTPREKVLEYALKRASELALKNGFRYFTILDQTGKGPGLHYPSIRLTIQCYNHPPGDLESIDAQNFISNRAS